MTDLAQPIAIAPTNHQELLKPALLLLPLPKGAEPKTVYVKPILVADIWHPGFALEETAQSWLAGGVTWGFTTDEAQYGLFINFVLLGGIVELEYKTVSDNPRSWFSDQWTPSGGQSPLQLCCAPIVAGVTTEYRFTATLPSGDKVDPKIVVTPLP